MHASVKKTSMDVYTVSKWDKGTLAPPVFKRQSGQKQDKCVLLATRSVQMNAPVTPARKPESSRQGWLWWSDPYVDSSMTLYRGHDERHDGEDQLTVLRSACLLV